VLFEPKESPEFIHGEYINPLPKDIAMTVEAQDSNNKDEQAHGSVVKIKYSIFSCYRGVFSSAIIFIIILMIGLSIQPYDVPNTPVLIGGILMATVALFIALFKTVQKAFFIKRSFYICNHPVLHIEDSLLKTVKDIHIKPNTFLDFDQSFFERMFNIGSITLQDDKHRVAKISEVSDFAETMVSLGHNPSEVSRQ